jgi:hypothetical protein
VIKTCRNDRIIKVERRMLIGAAWRFEETLRDSEDSSKLNTSFVERLKPHDPTGLGLSFSADDMPRSMEGASRKSPGVVSLLLQLRQGSQGAEIRKRGQNTSNANRLTSRRLTLREIFSSAMTFLKSMRVMFAFGKSMFSPTVDEMPMSLAA